MGTEWGLRAADADAAPSVVQLAVFDRAWVIDTAEPTAAIGELFKWIVTCERITLLGFAFSSDAPRIVALMNLDLAEEDSPPVRVVDLQTLALPYARKGSPPG